ncbi:MAG: PAS domain S-box protein [Oscillospiraceae bacterium]|nr:PAS domain S-box protein [Oscillospiraceae bacterium]
MVIRFDGIIELVNEAALTILGKSREELIGKSFAGAFFTDDGNDDFIQCVLDAVYQKGRQQESYVSYRVDGAQKQLRIVSSYQREGNEAIGVILVISDITELTEMRDAMRAMNTIQKLNRQLELRNRVLQETFGRYLSDDIVREILETPDGWKLGGEKRRLSILMSDLRGFTLMSERMQPQDLIAMVNHYFTQMYEEIERYHGTLIEFLGDGMLVIFGAPVPSENHAADAVAAAIGMQKRMAEVNRWNAERGYEPLAMGIGINTDTVILGNIGSEKRTKYGVLGAAVNLTGRIESYTTGGQILIAPATREAIREKLAIRRSFHVQPKGLENGVDLSEVTGIGAPYGICLEEVPAQPLCAVPPVPLRFSVLEGKHADSSVLNGTLLALTDAEALLESERELAPFDNRHIELGEGLYAKVTEAEGQRCRICFTAKPPEFDAWKCSLIQKRDKTPGEETQP